MNKKISYEKGMSMWLEYMVSSLGENFIMDYDKSKACRHSIMNYCEWKKDDKLYSGEPIKSRHYSFVNKCVTEFYEEDIETFSEWYNNL